MSRWEDEESTILPNINPHKRDIYPIVTCMFKHLKCDISLRRKTILNMPCYEHTNYYTFASNVNVCRNSVSTVFTVFETFYFSTWTVSKLWTSDVRTLNGIGWAVLNNERLAYAERDQSTNWSARWTHSERMMNDLFGTNWGLSLDSYLNKKTYWIFTTWVFIGKNFWNNSWCQFNAFKFGQALKLNKN